MFSRSIAILAALLVSGSVLLSFDGPVVATEAEQDYLPAVSICNYVPDAGFADVPAGHPNARDIDCIAHLGITKGTSATTYSPDQTVTREQMALFLTRLLPFFDLFPSEFPDRVAFTDIGHLSAASRLAIAQLADASLGITKGTSSTTFSPGAPVRRDHMALFLWRLMYPYVPAAGAGLSYGPFEVWAGHQDGVEIGTPFTDIEPYESYRGRPSTSAAITELWELGVVSGISPTTYGPGTLITRASMADFMVGALRHGLFNGLVEQVAHNASWAWCQNSDNAALLDSLADPSEVTWRHPYAQDILKYVIRIRVGQLADRGFCALGAVQVWAVLEPTLSGHSAPSADPPTPSEPSQTQSSGIGDLADIVIAPENCSGSDRANYNSIPRGVNWGNVGYLTQRTLASRDIDHVVALHEAWCSGVRDPEIGSDLANLRASDSSVNRGKGGRDPLEWWNTDGKTSPRKVDYPGWCDYLEIHAEVKVKYGATVDQAEYDFVEEQLEECESSGGSPPTTTTTTQPAAGGCPYTSGAGDPCAAVPALGNRLNDVNCGDIPDRYKPLTVVGTDYDRLDGNNDGEACSR